MSPPFLPLGIGLLLGGSATWFALRPPSAAPDLLAARSSLPAPATVPAWSWRDSATPPLLTRNSAGAAISAWLALRSPDGRHATYATRAASLRALLLQLPTDAFPRLLDGLSRSSNNANGTANDDDQRLRRIAFSSWTTQDAPAATRWAFAQGEKSSTLTGEALAAWSAKDAPSAAAWACALTDPELAARFASQSLSALAKKEHARALTLARSRDEAFRDAVLSSILQTFGKTDPAGTLRTFAPELWKNGRGFYALQSIIAAWVEKDAPAAIAWLLAQPRVEFGNVNITHWLSNLGGDSPASRRALADAIIAAPGVANRSLLMRDILLNWGSSNPDDLGAWLRQLPDPDLRINLLEIAAHISYSANPERHLPLALAMPEGANRANRLSELLGAWAKRDSGAALEWVKTHAAEPGVNEASSAVHAALLGEIAKNDPQAAITELRALSDPRARSAAERAIARAWGARDPAAALQWLADQHEAPRNRYFVGDTSLLRRWAKTEPEAALHWIEDRIATNPETQGMTSYYLEALAGDRHEKAPRAATADLYSKIKDADLRVKTLTGHVREWLTKDPSAARAWVVATPALTPAQRTTILTPAK